MDLKIKTRKRFGLIGKNIDYSFSKKYFEEKFIKENIKNHTYDNFDISSIDLVKKIFLIKDIKGLNVTIPYKQKIIPYLDFIDSKAKAINAVNTICFLKNGLTKGFNTDINGFEKALFNNWKKIQTKCLIFGTGGASKAVKYVLNNNNIKTTLVSRNPKKNQISYSRISKKILNTHKLIINCSPVGTYPNLKDAPNINYDFLTEKHFLFDLIYNPNETQFLKKGKERGCKILNGTQMLEEQAEKAWDIWNQ